MKTKMYLCALLFPLLPLLAAKGGAQNPATVSPVSSQTVLLAPYMYKLQDWSRMPAQRMQLRLRMLDTRVPHAVLYLKMEMQSNRLKIENPAPVPVPVNLGGGEEITLDAQQLAVYFSAANLQISGSASNRLQSAGGVLPDDVYSLRFRVFEARNLREVSTQEIPAVFNLASGEPPLVTWPEENGQGLYSSPCHLRFEWMPRHLAYANGFQTEYTFEIAQIPEGVTAIQEYFHTLPLVYKTTTANTFFDYGPEHPVLVPEKNYAVRIKATCLNAAGEELYIKNDGYSRVHNFAYREICPAAGSPRVEDVRATTARISWSEPAAAQKAVLYYRKNGRPDARWFKTGEIEARTQEWQLTDLEPSTGYECKVSVHCDYTQSDEDIIIRFTTLGSDNAQLECGKHNLRPDATRSTVPLEKLQPFDQIHTGNGFVIDVEKITRSNGNGVFSGTGNTHIPLLANTGVKVKFENVMINKNYELVSGVIKAESTITGL